MRKALVISFVGDASALTGQERLSYSGVRIAYTH